MPKQKVHKSVVMLMKSAIWERRNVAKKKKLCWMFGLCLKETEVLNGKYYMYFKCDENMWMLLSCFTPTFVV